MLVSEVIKVKPFGGPTYEKEDLLKMDKTLLRALLRERVHHNIEVPLYSILARGQDKSIPTFGMQAQIVCDVWKERNYTDHDPDIEWASEYLALAKKIRAGERIEWNKLVPTPFTDEEMAVVNK